MLHAFDVGASAASGRVMLSELVHVARRQRRWRLLGRNGLGGVHLRERRGEADGADDGGGGTDIPRVHVLRGWGERR